MRGSVYSEVSVMLGLFRKKRCLDPQSSQWLCDTFAWALENFGSETFYTHTILVTPTPRHFPERAETPEALIRHLFERVREYAGMQEWPCELVPQEADSEVVMAPLLVVQNAPHSPAGTFSVMDEEVPKVVITYNPDQVNDPEALTATFAHELAHYLEAGVQTEVPGGKEYHEYATDVLAVFMGFGIFLANSAFHFQQFTGVDSQGWSSRTQGYLSQYELVYALAIFALLKGLPRKAVETHLKPVLRPFYRQAMKELKNSECLARLRQ